MKTIEWTAVITGALVIAGMVLGIVAVVNGIGG